MIQDLCLTETEIFKSDNIIKGSIKTGAGLFPGVVDDVQRWWENEAKIRATAQAHMSKRQKFPLCGSYLWYPEPCT